MRSYPPDSPHAATRIVALTMIADGHVSQAELDVLKWTSALTRFGLSPDELQAVVHDLCEDLLAIPHLSWSEVCCVRHGTLAGLLAEVTDPMLCHEILLVCLAVATADQQITDEERVLVAMLAEHWRCHVAPSVQYCNRRGESAANYY